MNWQEIGPKQLLVPMAFSMAGTFLGGCLGLVLYSAGAYKPIVPDLAIITALGGILGYGAGFVLSTHVVVPARMLSTIERLDKVIFIPALTVALLAGMNSGSGQLFSARARYCYRGYTLSTFETLRLH
jgi:hypothetical protein